MPAVTGQGCNKNPPVRKDLPLHDMTGGNYWMPDAIQYLDSLGMLRMGGGLTSQEIAALNAGKLRAEYQLSNAAALELNGNILRVYNLTGHKLISGYPEGRRMWLNMNWYDIQGKHLREDGAYGPMEVSLGGVSTQVESILDLDDPNTKIYEAHYAITKDWAQKLLSVGLPSSLPLSYDRTTGAVVHTLGDLRKEPNLSSSRSTSRLTITWPRIIGFRHTEWITTPRRCAMPCPCPTTNTAIRDLSGSIIAGMRSP